MMGLGFKQSHKNLKHPKYLHALRRADEELGDVIILGAILAFGFGTFLWMFIEGSPPEAFTYYPERWEYLGFLYPLLNQFFFCSLFVWFLDSARAWPRVLILLTAVLHGSFFLIVGVLGGGESWQVVANGVALCYSVAIVWATFRQLSSRPEALEDRP